MISPLVGVRTPRTRRAAVVFPLPLSPARATIRGLSAGRVSVKWSRATVGAARWRKPPPKVFVTLRTSKSDWVMGLPGPSLGCRQHWNIVTSNSCRSRLTSRAMCHLCPWERPPTSVTARPYLVVRRARELARLSLMDRERRRPPDREERRNGRAAPHGAHMARPGAAPVAPEHRPALARRVG